MARHLRLEYDGAIYHVVWQSEKRDSWASWITGVSQAASCAEFSRPSEELLSLFMDYSDCHSEQY